MASNIYTRHYADGTCKQFKRIKQGRHVSGLPKADSVIAIHVTDERKREFQGEAKRRGMSESKLGELLLFFGLRELSVTDNCSNT